MPESPIKCEQRNTRAILDKKDLGLGTLYISEKYAKIALINIIKLTQKFNFVEPLAGKNKWEEDFL